MVVQSSFSNKKLQASFSPSEEVEAAYTGAEARKTPSRSVCLNFRRGKLKSAFTEAEKDPFINTKSEM